VTRLGCFDSRRSPIHEIAGFGMFHWSVALACVLITIGP
jgi:hypothetical protein